MALKPDVKQHNPDVQYINDLIDSTGLTQIALANLLGVDDRTVRRWQRGDVTVPYLVQFALESLVLNV
jgi:DNA-binding transcriptional regulator YiaG